MELLKDIALLGIANAIGMLIAYIVIYGFHFNLPCIIVCGIVWLIMTILGLLRIYL